MTKEASFLFPAEVQNAVAKGTNIVRAYREQLGYSLEDISATSGLSVDEVNKIETGHRFEKGYRSRIARALGLPEQVFEETPDVSTAA